MFTEEIKHQDGTSEKISHPTMPGNLRKPSAELQGLLFDAMNRIRKENPTKTDKELGALIEAEKIQVARKFVKKHGIAKACEHPNEVSLEAAKAVKKGTSEIDADQISESDAEELRQRYLVAVCALGHGEFASLTEEQLEDVASIVPQKRYSFNKFKKSLGA